ncbi:MAG: acyl carrier protein [Peptococcaceae bacterium]|nr:acyl carrier protein [Peptococcaceae bacterium]
METEIISFISQHLNLREDEILPESHLINDLGMSSLDIMQLISGVEERYGIEVDEYGIIENLTVGKISQFLASKIG